MSAKIKNIIFDLGGVILDIDETIVYKELETPPSAKKPKPFSD